MTFNSSSRWDDLRKKARSLENELDQKLVAFSKLGNSFTHNMDRDTAPMLSGDNIFETMEGEIDETLTNLASVNSEMSDFTTATTSSASMRHTSQRHRDILQDYIQEFSKTKTNIQAFRDREDLLGSVQQDIKYGSYKSGLNNRKQDYFIKENEKIMGVGSLTDDAISIAMATKENLYNQKGLLTGITSKMNQAANKFPLIGSLVNKINIRKRRDSIIIGGVITGCVIILFLMSGN